MYETSKSLDFIGFQDLERFQKLLLHSRLYSAHVIDYENIRINTRSMGFVIDHSRLHSAHVIDYVNKYKIYGVQDFKISQDFKLRVRDFSLVADPSLYYIRMRQVIAVLFIYLLMLYSMHMHTLL